MMMIAVAALLAAAPPSAPVHTSAAVQARATVRIISGARVNLAQANGGDDAPQMRSATIRTSAGPQAAKLIEFE
jgi:hypothetical protein